jgi:hypothetical protein
MVTCAGCESPLYGDLNMAHNQRAGRGGSSALKLCSRCWWSLPAETRSAIDAGGVRAPRAPQIRHILRERAKSVKELRGGRHTARDR